MARTRKTRSDLLQMKFGDPAPLEAETEAEKAVEMLRHDGSSKTGLLDALITLGNALQSRGNPMHAVEVYKEAQGLGSRLLGDKDVMMASILHNLGSAYLLLAQNQKALEHFQQALAIEESVLGAESAETSLTHLSLAEARHAMGDRAGALGEALLSLEVERRSGAEPGQSSQRARDLVLELQGQAAQLNGTSSSKTLAATAAAPALLPPLVAPVVVAMPRGRGQTPAPGLGAAAVMEA